jgi:hypothetical protein
MNTSQLHSLPGELAHSESEWHGENILSTSASRNSSFCACAAKSADDASLCIFQADEIRVDHNKIKWHLRKSNSTFGTYNELQDEKFRGWQPYVSLAGVTISRRWFGATKPILTALFGRLPWWAFSRLWILRKLINFLRSEIQHLAGLGGDPCFKKKSF